MSAAKAARDHLRDWYLGNAHTLVSMGVFTKDATHYGVPEGLIFSFPIRCTGGWKYEIIDNFDLSEYQKEKLQKNIEELQGEKVDAGLN